MRLPIAEHEFETLVRRLRAGETVRVRALHLPSLMRRLRRIFPFIHITEKR